MVKLKVFAVWLFMVLVIDSATVRQTPKSTCPVALALINELLHIINLEIEYSERRAVKTTHLVHPRLEMVRDDLTQIRSSVTEEKLPEFSRKTRVNPFFTCPVAEEIYPCVCSTDDDDVVLDCSAASTFEEIKSVLSSAEIPFSAFGKFTYNPDSTDTGDIPSNLFGPLTFESINIEYSTAETLADDAFAGSEGTLSRIIFDENTLLRFSNFLWVENFQELVMVFIGGSIIPTVTKFGAAPKLSQVSLAYSAVESVEQDAFSDLPSLLTLDLGANKLTQITDGLKIASLVLAVYLDANGMTQMTPFADAQPIVLELMHNGLTDFEQEIYQPILDQIVDCPITSYVSVTDNPIECTLMDWVCSEPAYTQHIYSSCSMSH